MKRDTTARLMTMEIVVGAFMVLILVGLTAFTIVLTRGTLFGPKYPLKVVFSGVMGLRDGDNVMARGMPIGKVKKLTLRPDGVYVVASLDQPVHLKKDYRITVYATSMLGGRALDVYEGSEGAPPIEATGYLKGEDPKDFVADISDVIASVKKALTEGGIVDNVKSASEALRDITKRVNSGEGFVGKLLSTNETLYADLSASVASVKAVAQRLEKGEGTLGKLLSPDDKLYADLSSSVANLRSLSDRLEKGEGTLGRLMSTNDQLYADLTATAQSLKNVAQSIDRGEGLVGRLVKDEKLAKQVDAIVGEVRAAVDDFRETTPVLTFTSILFGAL